VSDRDEVQVARWTAIKARVGASLRELRQGHGQTTSRSQARLAGELEELGYHVTQSMVSRYEQGVLEAPLTLERIVGWALCCEALSSRAFRELLSLAGYYLPWSEADLLAFDSLLRSYRRLSLTDQVVLRGRLLWHILGIGPSEEHA
jgi:transcriptional regulator with XRE-family HTH domain